jgi:hypothetical protein
MKLCFRCFQVSGYNLTVKLAEFNKSDLVLWSLRDQNADKSMWSLGQVAFKTDSISRIFIEASTGNAGNDFVGNKISLVKLANFILDSQALF